MTFEFLISYQATDGMDIYQVLREMLSQAMVNSQDEFEEDDVDHMIRINHRRSGEEVTGNDGKASTYTILGFALQMPEMNSVGSVVDDFTTSLSVSDSIIHSLRFEGSSVTGRTCSPGYRDFFRRDEAASGTLVHLSTCLSTPGPLRPAEGGAS